MDNKKVKRKRETESRNKKTQNKKKEIDFVSNWKRIKNDIYLKILKNIIWLKFLRKTILEITFLC